MRIWILGLSLLIGWGSAFGQTLELKADDLLRFKPAVLEVTSGSDVSLVFTNAGRIASQKHQFLLLKSGVDVDKFGNALLGNGGEMTPELQSQVIAASKPLGPGEKETLRFKAPEPGTYTYICGYPGHHSVSRGQFKVQ